MYLHTAGNLEAQKNEGKSEKHFQKKCVYHICMKRILIGEKKHYSSYVLYKIALTS